MDTKALKSVIEEIKRITRIEVSIWNGLGECVQSTTKLSTVQKNAIKASIVDGKVAEDGFSLGEITLTNKTIYLVLHQPNLDCIIKNLCMSQVEMALGAQASELSTESFLEQILTEELSDSYICHTASKLNVEMKQDRQLYLLACEEENVEMIYQLLSQMIDVKSGDMIGRGTPNILVYVQGAHREEGCAVAMAQVLVDMVEAEIMYPVRVAFGAMAQSLTELKMAYQEASIAMEVGRSFYLDRNILVYDQLGVGRLMHELPLPLSKSFLDEVLCGKGIEQFDDEIMTAVHKFFENNLNISETARQLYVHRNTLVYRLGKISKRTGLDIRRFDHAMTFKLAIMVDQHLKMINPSNAK